MRSAFNLKHFAAASVLLLFTLLFSCHRKYGETEMAAAEIIKITGNDAATGKLTLQDVNGKAADTFIIGTGKKMQWLLKTNTIKDVTNIYKKKTTSENVFSELPGRLGSSRNWGAKIKTSAGGKEEDYNIDWIDTAGNKHTYDPKIQVR